MGSLRVCSYLCRPKTVMQSLFSEINPTVLHWVVIPVLIFCARLLDVSIGTLRVVFIARGYRLIAPLLGFLEVLIWIIAISQVMKNLTTPMAYVAYAAGFATGNYLGLLIEERLALGQMVVRTFLQEGSTNLLRTLREENFRVTCVPGQGSRGKVDILFMIVRRKEVDRVIELIKSFNPHAFYSIEDVREVSEAQPPIEEGKRFASFRRLWGLRKGK